ncbi:DegV family protein [Loigolactobacillus backii]|uniref:DegV family protein n=1 Tax=Loigolactobacillus backii TaxID=375175 RepID=UPI0007F10FB3|nr:DegV family protein [Loigolactobacillus backii]ANK59497.1 fatty acid-binding protein DegV [Loigolactobacillus backii]ANK67114.1 fatty acid-binding protein DegV [Loigolactobacillus backii]OLF68855.1 DegV family EDD domain-containing protein [Loigolactobacillus backii]PIO87759.1 fatty acid-binding protein DegV [Loigolactobacillus backii]
MRIAVVTDSTAYLPQQLIKENNITVVPIPVILDGKTYDEGTQISTNEFYTWLRQSETLPSTTQPSIGEMVKLYRKLGDQGYDTVISIHLSSTISGFLNNLRNVDDLVPNTHVIPYDSQITVILMGEMVLTAAKMAKAGKTVDEILARLDALRETTDEYFIVNDLQNLVKGGRLSNASAFLGGMLRIKPILTFDGEHKIVAFEKIRSLKKAYSRVEELFDQAVKTTDYPIHAFIIHANDEAAAMTWRDELQAKYPKIKFDISYFGPVIGTHLGEKAIAIGWIKDEQV